MNKEIINIFELIEKKKEKHYENKQGLYELCSNCTSEEKAQQIKESIKIEDIKEKALHYLLVDLKESFNID